MTTWSVEPYDDTIDKRLRKFKSDTPVIKNFKNFVQELEFIDDPAEIGERKHGKYRDCFGAHMTKSVSLVYSVNYEKNTVYLVDLDNHKNLYGRDNHS